MGCSKARWRAKDVGRKGHHYIRLKNGKKVGRLRTYKSEHPIHRLFNAKRMMKHL